MLTGAFVFFGLAVVFAFIIYKGTNATLVLIAKNLFYFSLILFVVFLLIFVFSSIPPIPNDNKNLPL